MERNRKWKIPHTYRSRKLKAKLMSWRELAKEKKRASFVPFVLSEGNFF